MYSFYCVKCVFLDAPGSPEAVKSGLRLKVRLWNLSKPFKCVTIQSHTPRHTLLCSSWRLHRVDGRVCRCVTSLTFWISQLNSPQSSRFRPSDSSHCQTWETQNQTAINFIDLESQRKTTDWLLIRWRAANKERKTLAERAERRTSAKGKRSRFPCG